MGHVEIDATDYAGVGSVFLFIGAVSTGVALHRIFHEQDQLFGFLMAALGVALIWASLLMMRMAQRHAKTLAERRLPAVLPAVFALVVGATSLLVYRFGELYEGTGVVCAGAGAFLGLVALLFALSSNRTASA